MGSKPLVMIMATGALAAVWTLVQDPPTFTDPASAGADYLIQGEYTGEVEGDPWGAQVIALGDGKLQLVGYAGGLPGAGWTRGDERLTADGEMSSGGATFSADTWSARISNKKLAVFNPDGASIGQLSKTDRVSPTMGAKPPAGAVVLFDGSTPDQFKKGQFAGDTLLAANCESVEQFGDHSLHLEFRTPFKPHARGQARGNSGMYIQGRYEVQILDSFGLDGRDNECGGIYKIQQPKVNMCLPPLVWQTYDYEFTAARYDDGKKVRNAQVTIKHNGVVIHQDLDLPNGTPGKYPEADAPGPLYLQGHGNPVVFRNIWVVKRG